MQNIIKDLAIANEQTWLQIGQLSEQMKDTERALLAYENSLRHNPFAATTMTIAANLYRSLERYPKAVELFQRVLKLDESNGEVWGALGQCYLMVDDLHKAYSAYQQALYHLPNPRDPELWYGIGILYDRYGSYDHAEDAFTSVIEMDPNFEKVSHSFMKANEIYFRLGIIYAQQTKYDNALECFKYILSNPPPPLTKLDIRYQIGHTYEQKKDYALAKEEYERVLEESPNHAKVLQQLGWLYQEENTGFTSIEQATIYLKKSLEADEEDAQTWYLSGRVKMLQKLHSEAYDAFQQAVYKDGRNPTFWCSIGVLYYEINQYPDALDAYGRAIRLNPYISEVWYDLGTLYESCENQTSDALDAYTKALELDPGNTIIKTRVEELKSHRPGQPPLQPLPPLQPAPLDMNSSKFATGPSGIGPPPPQPAQQLGHAPRGSGGLRMPSRDQVQAEKRYKAETRPQ